MVNHAQDSLSSTSTRFGEYTGHIAGEAPRTWLRPDAFCLSSPTFHTGSGSDSTASYRCVLGRVRVFDPDKGIVHGVDAEGENGVAIVDLHNTLATFSKSFRI